MIIKHFASRQSMLRYARKIAAQALEAYGLEGSLKLMGVSDNVSYRVDCQGKRYLLRLHQNDHLGKAEIRSELEWLNCIKSDIIAPQGVMNKDGQLVTQIPTDFGIQSCTLMDWVDGRQLEQGVKPIHIVRIGSMMAKLHNLAQGFSPGEGFSRPTWGKESLLRDLQHLESNAADFMTVDDLEIFQAGAKQVISELQKLDFQEHGMIHADLHIGNLVFFQGEPRPIDFGRCGFGYFMYDIAQSLLGIHPQDRGTFLEGYREERPLVENHLFQLEMFFVMGCIENVSFHSSNPQEHEDLKRKAPMIAKIIKAFLDGESFIMGRK